MRSSRIAIGFAAGAASGVLAALLVTRRSEPVPTAVDVPVGGAPLAPSPADAPVARRAPADELSRLRDENERLRAQLRGRRPAEEAATGGEDEPDRARRRALKELEAPLARLRELSPARFGDMTAQELYYLRDLDLTALEVTDEDLAALRLLPSLRDLQLQKTGITDAGLPFLADIPSLVHLGLRETLVTDDGMLHIQHLTDLTRLDVNMTQVSDRGLSYLQGLTELEFLRLNYSRITDDALGYLSGMDRLERLDLWGTKITDDALDRIWDLPALTHLELGATSLSRAAVERFAEAHPDCYVSSPYGR